jgi:hypothetical protein
VKFECISPEAFINLIKKYGPEFFRSGEENLSILDKWDFKVLTEQADFQSHDLN